MLEHRMLRYTFYSLTTGLSVVLLSEVIYRGYLYVRERLWRRDASDDEIAEVIWTNELTQICAGSHILKSPTVHNSPSKVSSGLSSNGMIENGHITKLPSPSNSPICNNRFCADRNVGRLISLLDESKYTIDLAMYTFTSYVLCQAFMRAIRRGVSVRIISDKEMVYSSGSYIITLTKAGVPVRCPMTTMLMHHKFCLIDAPKRAQSVLANVDKLYDSRNVKGVLMSGSLNWTMQGFGGNWENIVVSSNKMLVEQFEDEFQRMWLAFAPRMST
ncbi:mitochondrial cardiolipin hydrolase [Ceratitis capitata]|uniref:Mitochondrial cardiolipin hydrolase n=1 Tax=Ceratitis capitata TaxID=7213 RepID=W8AYK0_CERCA|nr:mitochondrial cardiolipin hydrolase [Ceratitis capitata]XP_020714664.1 mitochondrial cardiolipin hydrolase [Ceratitis capitata]XP_020714665.1 mitochondrial cardiolipin hydrolase [Ceratitis capitata]XP_020714666.1 mitochondrial cardiolipin hydrolase [Ceratitis capitata]